MPSTVRLSRNLSSLALALAAGAAHADVAADCENPALAPAARIASCDVAIRAAAEPAEQARLTVMRAAAHRAWGDNEAARSDLAVAEDLVPAMEPPLRVEFLVQRSEVLRNLGDLEAALADVVDAEQLAPDDADPVVNHAMVLYDQGDAEAALAQLARAREMEPNNQRALLQSMWVLKEAGDPQTCVELGERVVEIAPARPHSWFYRGNCLYDLGPIDEAVVDYETAAAIGMTSLNLSAVLHDNLSMAYLTLERPEEALDAARRAVEFDPMQEGARLSLVSALVATGAPDEAIAAYEQAKADGVEDTLGASNNLAWSLYLGGYYDEALPIMEAWLAAHPEPTAEQTYELDTAAHVMAAVGRSDEAIDLFLRAAELGGPEQRTFYESRLTELGFAPAPGEEGLKAAFTACVATGTACLISP